MSAPSHGLSAAAGRDIAGPLGAQVAEAMRAIDAPDVVVAASVRGHRVILCGGDGAEPPGAARIARRYEVGSITKTFTGLLTADLAARGVLRLDDPLTAHLPPPQSHPQPRTGRPGPASVLALPHVPTGVDYTPEVRRITLRHLATHTSGLPRLPRDLLFGAFVRPHHNSYTAYDGERLLRAFARVRPRTAPGRRWHYSNFGVALLGTALCNAAGSAYPELLAARVLRPLGLNSTTAYPVVTSDTDAMGHAADGTTPVPVTGMGAFEPAAAVRATPGDLLTYLEAHLDPGSTSLAPALRAVCATQLEHGARHRSAHTLGWFQHPAPGGPLLFHPGATFGQQAFVGLHPASGTAVTAVATRRGRSCRLVPTAYNLLHALAAAGRG